MSSLQIIPISISGAIAYVSRWHRHSSAPRGGLFAVACIVSGAVEPCGVAVIGRPVARMMQDGRTCEVTRLATDGTRNACSFLYSAAKRVAQALGYTRCITYTLASESGASLRAVGAVPTVRVVGRSWDTPSRKRTDKTVSQRADKVRWSLFDARKVSTEAAQ